jgi:hypothetical protein
MDITQLHSALMIVFSTSDEDKESEKAQDPDQAIVYTPHGLPPTQLPHILLHRPSNLRVLALLHGLDRIHLSHPLATAIVGPHFTINLGAENGYQLAKILGAKYWVGTHDEDKTGEGIVGKVLERRVWSAGEVMESVTKESNKEPEAVTWVDVRNGECLILE